MKRILLVAFVFAAMLAKAQNTMPSYLLGRSTGKLPSLSYGLGEDRLGGARMGYLDTNVVLRIIDSTREMYTIQLSRYHTAYIERQYVKTDTVFQLKPFYLTNSYMAKGDTAFDYVSINVDEKLPYKSWMEIDPAKIMLDIYGVQSNTNWITQLQSLKEVKNIYYNQVEDDVVRVTIELKHSQHWGYSIGYQGHNLVVRIKRQPQKLDLANLKIAIDAGHGGDNSGSQGPRTRAVEKNYTLLFAKALEKNLKKLGVKKVIMTRIKDTSFDIKDRILFLQEQNPDILISLHLNSAGNSQIKGVSTYYRHIGFRPLTTSILKKMLELGLEEYGNVGSFNFALSGPTDFPNSLVEIGFLSNAEDERRIVSTKFHTDVAAKITLGISEWLKAMK